MGINKKSATLWYAMRITYCREMILKKYLDEIGVKCFVPMRREDVPNSSISNQKRIVPAIHNLIFIHSTREIIDDIRMNKFTKFPIKYMIDKFTNLPLIIPENQMQQFITINSAKNEEVITVPLDLIRLRKGMKVRVLSGYFKGLEGWYMRVAGDRRVVVVIDNLMAMGTTFIHPKLLEKIE
ncbi:MAG: UpxY family transcription antiterminator [Paludibacteraceae bacterium]